MTTITVEAGTAATDTMTKTGTVTGKATAELQGAMRSQGS